ncbi:MAG: alpha-hydroxy-acid oxidizing protein [Halioglobus sp.]|nr:alpha-hydroxy-acid oxidizing protein [Halioglobus sp.]
MKITYSKKLSAIPRDIVSLDDYQRHARGHLSEAIYEYIAAGVADDITLHRNTQRFQDITLQSRVLRDFSHASTGIHLLGREYATPIILAPVAYQRLVHPDGEKATALAADAMGTPMVTSTLSSVALREIADCNGAGNWFQLYPQAKREDTLTLVKRAEQAGYDTVVVTVDAAVSGLRNRAQRAGFALPADIEAVNCRDFESVDMALRGGDSVILNGIMAQAPQWPDLEWLRAQTSLPVIVKGISHPQDALQARSAGADAIIVSNHGGRTLDSLPASIDSLPAVRAAVGEAFPVLLDSGVRRGTDIVKAIALGADAVLIGRPQVFSLAVAGALGVAHMLRLLREELEIAMALTGCATIAAIQPDCLHREEPRHQC